MATNELITDWTAFYAPVNGAHAKSGFKTKEEAKAYAKQRQDLDSDAWWILPTKFYLKCEGMQELTWASGYYPVPKAGAKEPDFNSERWKQYQEFLKKLGLPETYYLETH